MQMENDLCDWLIRNRNSQNLLHIEARNNIQKEP